MERMLSLQSCHQRYDRVPGSGRKIGANGKRGVALYQCPKHTMFMIAPAHQTSPRNWPRTASRFLLWAQQMPDRADITVSSRSAITNGHCAGGWFNVPSDTAMHRAYRIQRRTPDKLEPNQAGNFIAPSYRHGVSRYPGPTSDLEFIFVDT